MTRQPLPPDRSGTSPAAAPPGSDFWFGNRFWQDLAVNVTVSLLAVLAVALADPILLAEPGAWAIALLPGLARTVLTAALAVFARHGVVLHG